MNAYPEFIQINADYYVRVSNITEAWLSVAGKDSQGKKHVQEWRLRLSTTPTKEGVTYYGVGEAYGKLFGDLMRKLVVGDAEAPKARTGSILRGKVAQ